MIQYVLKRNGVVVPYDINKIDHAIQSAFIELNQEWDRKEETLSIVQSTINDIPIEPVLIEKIQDIVEDVLIQLGYIEVAKAYIRYRYKKELLRKANTTDKSIKELLDGESEYWNKENSNKNAKWVTTQRDYLAGITSKDIARRFIFPKEIMEAHDAGIIHIHDLDYAAQNTLHNCFSADTKFVTQEGVKSFKDFYDGAPVVIRDKDGVWRSAVVHNFGKQILYTITLQSGRSIKEVRCTRNHRWILKDGNVTENLQIGDVLYPLSDVASGYEPKTIEEIQSFCLGFILGDGVDISNNRGVRVRLCGHKKDDYLHYFEQAGYQISEIKDNDDVVATNKDVFSKQTLLDSRAWKLMSSTQKIALFNGYYSADGCTDRNAIHTSDERALELITELAPIAGYYIASINRDIHNTPYKQNAVLYKITFRKKTNVNNLWKVKNIQKSYNNNHKSNVWCVIEPITHSFTLASGIVTGNCCLINLEDMLQNGTIVNGITIDKPHRLSTAMTIATQIIAAVASSQYGGTTINLAHLAPFVRASRDRYYKKYIDWDFSEDTANLYADRDTKKEVSDAVQTLNYQLNSLSTTNGQAPFISIFMYLNDTEEYKNELAILIEEILKQRIQGMKNRQGVYVTPAFPKLLYVLEEDNISVDSPYWYLTELAAKCTAKRMVPDYISEKKMREYKLSKGESEGHGDVYGCMGCRSFLTPDRSGNGYDNIAHAKNYDGKPKYWGRFNIGVCTINLADLGLSAIEKFNQNSNKETLEEIFWKMFDERTELCHTVQRIRAERLSKTKAEVAPILWCDGALARLDPEDTLDPLIHHGYCTSSLGYAGLYECVKAITGESHTSEKGREFGLRVMQFLNDQCTKWKQAEDIDYSVYGSPIESTTYKFAQTLQDRFGEVPGITDRDYVTNSYHIPVFEDVDAFEKLTKEAEFQRLSPGGAISYVETSNLQNNIPAIETVIKFIYNNIMYAELNCKSDYCQECGYDGEIQIKEAEDGHHYFKCPNCGNTNEDKMNIARRVCGYISTNGFNEGRLEEIANRVVHLDDKDL